MALKVYQVGNTTWQYEEGEQPDGAVEVKEKSKTPANKARTSTNKAVEPDTK